LARKKGRKCCKKIKAEMQFAVDKLEKTLLLAKQGDGNIAIIPFE
jgi:hypothetical protein